MKFSAAYHHLRSLKFAIVSTILLSASAYSNPVYNPLHRLNHTVVPTFEKIVLKVDAEKDDYSGEVMIALTVNEATKLFHLHAESLVIKTVTLMKEDKNIPIKYVCKDTFLLEIKTEKELKPGQYQLNCTFENDYNRHANSLYKVVTDSVGYLFTQFEDDEARKAFPCWDEPEWKIPFQMIVSIPKQHIAVSNTPILSETPNGDWTTVVFDTTPPMPSYIVALAAGPLEKTPIVGLSVPGNIVTVKGGSAKAGNAAKIVAPIMEELERYFGRPYPYQKLDVIGAPEFLYGAMENAGAIVFRESHLLLDPVDHTPQQQRRLVTVMAHEIAHMWFGDLVTMEWWDDLWLNESFASWMEEKTSAKVYPELVRSIDRVGSANRAMVSDARVTTQPVRREIVSVGDLSENANFLVYNKGQAILEMFETYLGEETFQKGVIEYINTHAWKNARAEDLWGSLAEAAGIPIDKAIESFITKPGLPIVTFTELGENKFRVSQKRFHNYGAELKEWPTWQIPLSITYGDGTTSERKTFLLTDTSEVIELPAAHQVQWLYPNADAGGYYRWNIPATQLTLLSQKSKELLSAKERIGFLQNSSALFDAGTISGDTYLSLMSGFADDDEPLVISSMLTALNRIRNSFVTEDIKPAYEQYIRTVLAPAYKRFGALPKDNESPTLVSLRTELIATLADVGDDPAIQHTLDSITNLFFTDSTYSNPTMKRTACISTATRGDQTFFDDVRTRLEKAKSNEERGLYLEMLGSFRDSALMQQALTYAYNAQLRPQEIWYIPATISEQSDKSTDVVFKSLIDNFDHLKAKVPAERFSSIWRYIGGCSQERVDAAQAFFAKDDHTIPGIEQTLKRVADATTDCLNLRKREGNAVNNYLLTHANGNNKQGKTE